MNDVAESHPDTPNDMVVGGGSASPRQAATNSPNGGKTEDRLADRTENDTRDADERLFNRLASQGFAGPEYEAFANKLARFGFATMKSWIRSGRIFKESADRGRPLARREFISYEDSQDLALETCAAGLASFQKRAILEKGWRPDGGSSLSTYFIGACVYQFPNVYRGWLRSQRSLTIADAGVPNLVHYDYRPEISAEDTVIPQLDFERILSELPPKQGRVLLLNAYGYSHAEIGEQLGITSKAVEGLLRRARHAAQKII
jgi:RNA polymerase sigma factor (sigma-70 family)